MAKELTKAGRTFIERMAQYVMDGASFDDAAERVLLDDQRLFAAVTDRSDAGEKLRDVLTTSIWTGCQMRACAQRVFA